MDSAGADLAPKALAFRLRQQAILSDFGVEALRATELLPLLQRATELCAEGMEAQFCKALEYKPHQDCLLVCAGIGWAADAVGTTIIGADLASPAGYALKTGRPVISNHLENETRFRTPKLMADHGIRRAINVLIANRDGNYGVLEVDDTREGQFEEADIAFMQGFANLVGGAIERQRAEARLKAALERQELLSREMSHRVKNSLAVVAGFLGLQARGSDNADVKNALADARTRVEAVAQVHDQLWRQPSLEAIDVAGFLEALCAKLQESAPRHRLVCRAARVNIPADLAIPLGLFVNELVTNAIKYAYPDGEGEIRVEARPDAAGTLILAVEDDGAGLPEGFDPAAARSASLGMRIVNSLARQLGGTLAVAPDVQGAHFSLRMAPLA
ncbi:MULTISPECIES: histidine kinase dimerization/phosphoacceptor domain -containing protein [unclassified Methylobacterium]|uniref:sensor histidine kinase n=1 Tax=unclassified Methylobacterium TaxID=2615210 RepID=UPI0006FE2EBB|nr:MULTISPECIES: histidine kinase dimerization/phosphoacceptor domain -containing protein [unclassified Methylobacterium]KQP77798.1 histidine kinase [Methylobacterium sp. Leaf113]MCK2053906.1 GAF domain-containing protein [Methylobacterium sp. 37f]